MTVWAVMQRNGAIESLWTNEALARRYVEGLENKLPIKEYTVGDKLIPIPLYPKEMAYDRN